MTDAQTRHLEMLQGVIARMAANSFALKGWSVTVTAALISLAAKDANVRFAMVALYPALAFWGLDAYFLRQERRFRALFDAVRRAETAESFTMDPSGADAGVPSWFQTLLAGTLAAVYLPILVAIASVIGYAALKD